MCANYRINRCRLFPVQHHRIFRGYQASKKQSFYGFKVHLLVTAQGQPVEFFLSKGSLHDLEGMKRLPLDLPRGATLYGDKAYNDQNEEWLLQDAAKVRFVSLRRANVEVPLPPYLVYLTQSGRHRLRLP